MAFTDYLNDKILDENFEGVKLALFTDEETEVSDDDYKRQTIKFTDSKDGEIENTEEVKFPVAKKRYGTITHVGIYSEDEELIEQASLDNERDILEGDQFVIDKGGYKIKLD